MLETLTTARPLFAPDPKLNAPGSESGTPPRTAPSAQAPLPAPSELLRLTLQSAPPPPEAPPRAPRPEASPPRREEAVILTYRPETEAAPGVNALSLFQGMLTEASRSGANVPGTSMHIYALVQQLSTLVENKLELAA